MPRIRFTSSCDDHIFVRPKPGAPIVEAESPLAVKIQLADDRISVRVEPDRESYRLQIGPLKNPDAYEVVKPRSLRAAQAFAIKHNVHAPCLLTRWTAEDRRVAWSAIGDPRITPGLATALHERKTLGQEITRFQITHV